MRQSSTHAGPTALLIGNHAPPYGGIPGHVTSLAPYLVARGWQVRVLRPSHRPAPVEHVDGYTVQWRSRITPLALAGTAMRHAARLRVDPRALLTSPRATGHALSLFRSAMSIAREHPIDVVAAYHLFPAGLAGAWLSEVTGAALVTTIFGEVYSSPAQHAQRIAAVRFIAERSAKLLSCSRHCAESLSALLDLDTPVDVLYYGADVDRLAKTDGAAVRRTLGLGDADRLVLFVGRMVHEMGLHTLLEATPAILGEPNVHVMIAGATGVLTREAQALASRHPGRVSVRPDLSFDERDAAYAAADIVVAPSINARACLGLALIEAMAAGAAVIGCHVGGTAEVVTDGVDGVLIPPSYADGLVLAVQRLVREPALAARLAVAGRAKARRFAVDATNQQMEAVLRAALASGRPQPQAEAR